MSSSSSRPTRLTSDGSASPKRKFSRTSRSSWSLSSSIRRSRHWGVHPDQSRNRLIFTGNGEKGVALPLADWGYEFAEQMPEEIRAAIKKARGEGPNTLEDEEYRRRLQDKFGDRWRVKQIVQAKESDPSNRQIDVTDEKLRTDETELTGVRRHRKRRRPRAVHVIRFRTTDGATGEGVEREIAVDVPKFRFSREGRLRPSLAPGAVGPERS